jgi:hypothetical protein
MTGAAWLSGLSREAWQCFRSVAQADDEDCECCRAQNCAKQLRRYERFLRF